MMMDVNRASWLVAVVGVLLLSSGSDAARLAKNDLSQVTSDIKDTKCNLGQSLGIDFPECTPAAAATPPSDDSVPPVLPPTATPPNTATPPSTGGNGPAGPPPAAGPPTTPPTISTPPTGPSTGPSASPPLSSTPPTIAGPPGSSPPLATPPNAQPPACILSTSASAGGLGALGNLFDLTCASPSAFVTSIELSTSVATGALAGIQIGCSDGSTASKLPVGVTLNAPVIVTNPAGFATVYVSTASNNPVLRIDAYDGNAVLLGAGLNVPLIGTTVPSVLAVSATTGVIKGFVGNADAQNINQIAVSFGC